MSQRMQGRVVLITGAARSQGRSHAVRLAEEGADIIGVDICGPVGNTADYYAPASADELAETEALVSATGRRMVAVQADVRDLEQLSAAVARGVSELGGLDVVLANAGIHHFGALVEDTEAEDWRDVFAVNVEGVFLTCKVAIPLLKAGAGDRSIIITSSAAGVRGFPNLGQYTASKHAVVGLMRTLALELGPHGIRVNVVAPTTTDTIMVQNDPLYRLFVPDQPNPTVDDFARVTAGTLTLPVPWVESRDVSNAILFLASEEARFITGQVLAVDAGMLLK